MQICEGCGRKISDNALRCPYCGHRIRNRQDEQETPRTTGPVSSHGRRDDRPPVKEARSPAEKKRMSPALVFALTALFAGLFSHVICLFHLVLVGLVVAGIALVMALPAIIFAVSDYRAMANEAYGPNRSWLLAVVLASIGVVLAIACLILKDLYTLFSIFGLFKDLLGGKVPSFPSFPIPSSSDASSLSSGSQV